MAKIQEKGEIPEDELKALELDMTGKVCCPILRIPTHHLNVCLIRLCLLRGEEPDSRSCRSYERLVKSIKLCSPSSDRLRTQLRSAITFSKSLAFPRPFSLTVPR